MQKIIIFVSLVLIVISSTLVVSAEEHSEEIKTFFQEYSQIEEAWEGGRLIRGEHLYGENNQKIGSIHRVFNKGAQQGYILYLDNIGIVEASFEGEDLASNIKGKVYYILPGKFLNQSDYFDLVKKPANHNRKALVNEKVFNTISTELQSGVMASGNPLTNAISTSTYNYSILTPYVMNLASNYSSYSTSMTSKHYIENVPDYQNYSYGPISLGCFPTSAAMLIAYYDNEIYNTFSYLEGLMAEQFPINHSTDRDLVDELIIEIANFTGNCADYSTGENTIPHDECHTISGVQGMAGVQNYLESKNHAEWSVVADKFSTNSSQYRELVSLGNPTLVTINNHPIYSPGGIEHTVLGVGYYMSYMSNPGLIVYDNWNSTGREIWISYSAVEWFIFLHRVV